MDQRIGIEFGASSEQFERRVKEMIKPVRELSNELQRLDRLKFSIGKLGSSGPGSMKAAAQHTNKLNAQLRKTKDIVAATSAQILGLASSVARYGSAVKAAGIMPGIVPGLISGAGKAKGLTGTGFGSPTDPRWAPAWMLRWWGTMGGAYAGTRFAGNTLFGRSRKDIINPLRDLSMVGLDDKQRRQTEISGMKFLRQNWGTGTLADYINAVAEAGSAFSGLDVKQLNRIGQAGMKLGAASQLSGEAGTKLLMNAVHAQLAMMGDKKRAGYKSGKSSYAGFAESTAAKIAKIIDVASLWGVDIGHFSQYALPTALSKGWSLDKLLGLVGAIRTAGIPAAKSGRGLRAIMEAETGKLAKLKIAGALDPREWQKFQAMKSAEQQAKITETLPGIKKRISHDPFSLFADINKWIGRAEGRNIDPVQHVKLSRQWIGLTRMVSKPGLLEKWKEQTRIVSKMNDLTQVEKRIRDFQTDAGWISKRFSDSWGAFQKSLGRNSPFQKVVGLYLQAIDDTTDAINRGASRKHYINELGTFLQHGIGGALGGITEFNRQLGEQLRGKIKSSVSNMHGQVMNGLHSYTDTLSDVISGIGKHTKASLDAVGKQGGLGVWLKGRGSWWLGTFKDLPWALSPGSTGSVPTPVQPGPKITPKSPQPPQLPPKPVQPSSLDEERLGQALGNAIATQLTRIESGEKKIEVRVDIGKQEFSQAVGEVINDNDMGNRKPWRTRRQWSTV